MSETKIEECHLLDGERCITTTEFKRRLGLNVTSNDLMKFGISPVISGPTAVYWKESDVFYAAMSFADELMQVAIRNHRR